MRLLTLALLTALAVPAAHAQLIPSLDIGVAGGVNFASLSDAGGLDLDSSTGYHIGAFADFGVLYFSARTGLYYFRAGEIPGAGTGGDPGTVSFVTIPVDFQFQTPTPILKGYALVGPEFRFPLNGIDTFESDAVNYAVNVGLGVKGSVPVAGYGGFLEVRYARDLSGINGGMTLGSSDVKVHLFMIRAGIGL